MSYAFCAKAAVPLMRQTGGGAIVNVASVRSVIAGGGALQYDTTKAAVAGLTRGLGRPTAYRVIPDLSVHPSTAPTAASV